MANLSVWFSKLKKSIQSGKVSRLCTHFPFPNQFPTQATTEGQPVVCMSPFMTCRRSRGRWFAPTSQCWNDTSNQKKGHEQWPLIPNIPTSDPSRSSAVIWCNRESCDEEGSTRSLHFSKDESIWVYKGSHLKQDDKKGIL